MRIGLKIRELRCTNNWTQAELAERCALNRNSIYQYEIGSTTPKIENLRKIALAFGDINLVDYFLDETFSTYSQWKEYMLPQGDVKLPNEDLSSEEYCLLYDFRRLNKDSSSFVLPFINELVFLQHGLRSDDYNKINEYIRFLNWKNEKK